MKYFATFHWNVKLVLKPEVEEDKDGRSQWE